MKNFEDEMGWTERKTEKANFVAQIKERMARFLKGDPKATVEDRYELESCRTLELESISEWILRNKKEEYDGALLVRMKDVKISTFPFVVGIMFLHDNKVCLGKEHLKKIVHCTYLSEELNDMFEGKESLIIK
uniref:hypothetical protein n=1 Tax=Alloprevotella sp. TaxID=1872471 RepID=UPI003FEE386B